MFDYMKKLPSEIICHISGYYGQKIPDDLSREIGDQRLLCAIKEKEYYNKTHRTWHSMKIIAILISEPEDVTEFSNKYPWKIWDSMINRLWWAYSHQERMAIVSKHFPYAYDFETTFITGRELIYSKLGYYI